MPDVYETLAHKMSNLAIRNPMSKELRKILEALFTPEEAELLQVFNLPLMDRYSAKRIARKLKKPVEEIEPILYDLGRRQRLNMETIKGKRVYSLFPLVPGLFETFFANHKRAMAEEREVAELFAEEFDKYYMKGFASEMTASTHPLVRVCVDPKVLDDSVKRGKAKLIQIDEQITDKHTLDVLPCEQASTFLDKAKKIALMDCCCKSYMRILNKGIPVGGYPINVCMCFDALAEYGIEYGFGRSVTKEEALEVIRKGSEAGLVHTTENLQDGLSLLCNCDPECCIALRGLSKFRNPSAVAKSNFQPEYSRDPCQFCETCVEKCPMRAIQHHYGHASDKSDEKIMINRNLCIGCGTCAFNCPTGAITMVKKLTQVPNKDMTEMATHFLEGRVH